MAGKKLSEAQIAVLTRFAYCAGASTIERQPGGFWTIGGVSQDDWYVGTPTVRAMARMGLLEPCEYAAGDKPNRFIVGYRLTAFGLKGVAVFIKERQ